MAVHGFLKRGLPPHESPHCASPREVAVRGREHRVGGEKRAMETQPTWRALLHVTTGTATAAASLLW